MTGSVFEGDGHLIFDCFLERRLRERVQEKEGQ